MDGMWEVQTEHPIPLGTVQRFDAVGDGEAGWAFANMNVRRMGLYAVLTITGFLGARISTTPTRSYEFDGEEFVEDCPNYGIDEAIIEAAVRHMAEQESLRRAAGAS